MKDYRLIHTDKAIRERRELIMPEATLEQFRHAVHRRELPVGSVYLWAIGVVGAPNSASNEDQWWNK